MQQDDEIHRHKEKLRRWNQQRERDHAARKVNIEQGMESYATKLIERMGVAPQKNNNVKKMQKEISNQIESNVCSICLDLMVPPDRQPIILFPCGHNLCKDCLFDHPPKGNIKKNLPLKLKKCSLCRLPIESYALNRSLMTLICTYTNNRELLQRQIHKQEANQEQDLSQQKFQQLKIRFNLLEKQKMQLKHDQNVYQKQKVVLAQVIDTLKKQKRKNEKQIQKLEEEAKLINRVLGDKIQQMQILDKKLRQVQDKNSIVEKALTPIQKEKQKLQLLQVAKLLGMKH